MLEVMQVFQSDCFSFETKTSVTFQHVYGTSIMFHAWNFRNFVVTLDSIVWWLKSDFQWAVLVPTRSILPIQTADFDKTSTSPKAKMKSPKQTSPESLLVFLDRCQLKLWKNRHFPWKSSAKIISPIQPATKVSFQYGVSLQDATKLQTQAGGLWKFTYDPNKQQYPTTSNI